MLKNVIEARVVSAVIMLLLLLMLTACVLSVGATAVDLPHVVPGC